MSFPEFDAPTQSLLISALNDAWAVVGDTGNWSADRRAETTAQLTRQLLFAAEAGERNHSELVKAALHNVELEQS